MREDAAATLAKVMGSNTPATDRYARHHAPESGPPDTLANVLIRPVGPQSRARQADLWRRLVAVCEGGRRAVDLGGAAGIRHHLSLRRSIR